MQAIRNCSVLCHFNAVKLYTTCTNNVTLSMQRSEDSLIPRPEMRLVKTLQTTEVTNGMCSLLWYSLCTKRITW